MVVVDGAWSPLARLCFCLAVSAFNRVCIIVPLLDSIVTGSFSKQTKIAIEVKIDFTVQWVRDVETMTAERLDVTRYDIIISTSIYTYIFYAVFSM